MTIPLDLTIDRALKSVRFDPEIPELWEAARIGRKCAALCLSGALGGLTMAEANRLLWLAWLIENRGFGADDRCLEGEL